MSDEPVFKSDLGTLRFIEAPEASFAEETRRFVAAELEKALTPYIREMKGMPVGSFPPPAVTTSYRESDFLASLRGYEGTLDDLSMSCIYAFEAVKARTPARKPTTFRERMLVLRGKPLPALLPPIGPPTGRLWPKEANYQEPWPR